MSDAKAVDELGRPALPIGGRGDIPVLSENHIRTLRSSSTPGSSCAS
jgi:hypothetical protein